MTLISVSACICCRPTRTTNRTVFYSWSAVATFSFPKCHLNGWQLTPCSKKCGETATSNEGKGKYCSKRHSSTIQVSDSVTVECKLFIVHSKLHSAGCLWLSQCDMPVKSHRTMIYYVTKKEGRRNKARSYQNTIVSRTSDEYASHCFWTHCFFLIVKKINKPNFNACRAKKMSG